MRGLIRARSNTQLPAIPEDKQACTQTKASALPPPPPAAESWLRAPMLELWRPENDPVKHAESAPKANEAPARPCQVVVLYHTCGCRSAAAPVYFCSAPGCAHVGRPTTALVGQLPFACGGAGNDACGAADPARTEFVREIDTAERLAPLIVLEDCGGGAREFLDGMPRAGAASPRAQSWGAAELRSHSPEAGRPGVTAPKEGECGRGSEKRLAVEQPANRTFEGQPTPGEDGSTDDELEGDEEFYDAAELIESFLNAAANADAAEAARPGRDSDCDSYGDESTVGMDAADGPEVSGEVHGSDTDAYHRMLQEISPGAGDAPGEKTPEQEQGREKTHDMVGSTAFPPRKNAGMATGVSVRGNANNADNHPDEDLVAIVDSMARRRRWTRTQSAPKAKRSIFGKVFSSLRLPGYGRK
ncbi:hypothetical protein GGS23DRAFT_598314 [Durotheca rogersii]|uniref:uncharacterized protein n=1 Tax=Durotheca rogersii TaxID=419775 RepID=UPI00221FC046|nr:uncharacterized protein GGS23DRAFT_598314 [Durotheca rogersii]KAI5861534.1 hypothetical protein GGS23DRAFT_598314 [Durotheca rogersii]